MFEVEPEVLVETLINRLQRLARYSGCELAIGLGTQITEAPRLNRLVGIDLAPGIKNLFQPSFDIGCVHSCVAGGSINLGAMFRRIGNRQRDHAPIRTVRFVVAIDRLPQRGERHEDSLPPLRLFDLMKQVKHRLAIDLSALETDIVALLRKARQQRRSQRRIIQVLAGCFLAFSRSSRIKGRRNGFGERRRLRTHRGNSFGVVLGKTMVREFCQACEKFLAFLAIQTLPCGAVLALIAR